MKLIKNYSSSDFLKKYVPEGSSILNAGSAGVRFAGYQCTNVDIQDKEGVDVVADIQSLWHDQDSMKEETFDAVICVAVLQYCPRLRWAVRSLYWALKPGGLIFVDAPWCQPYCKDTPDLQRLSGEMLYELFDDDHGKGYNFEVIESGPSIRPGSALAMLAIDIFGSLTGNRYVDFALRKLAIVLTFPLLWIRTSEEEKTCGAFYLIAKKR